MYELRQTRQLKPDLWITECRACPRRHGGRKAGPTQQAMDLWWANHVETAAHRRWVSNDEWTAKWNETNAVLNRIFPDAARIKPKAPPSSLRGEVVIRPRHVLQRDEDNPHGT